MEKTLKEEKPLVISYLRWSSGTQRLGDSERRQMNLASKWLEKNGYEINEDYQDTNPAVTETPLNLSPFALFGKDSVSSTAGRDNDGSEVLTFRLQGIPDELIIEQNGVPVDSTMILESLDGLTVRPDENVSGTFTFDVISIATEQNPAAGATSAEISKESAPQQITFEVTGVADEPTVNAKNITSFLMRRTLV